MMHALEPPTPSAWSARPITGPISQLELLEARRSCGTIRGSR